MTSPTDVIDSFCGDYRFLSNFSPNPVRIEEGWAPTVEHAFQALKTTDVQERSMILSAETPADAKSLGRRVSLRAGWDELRDDIMFQLLLQKFVLLPRLGMLLVKTGDAKLVEGNSWHDSYWGVCLCGDCPTGKNRLGELLMTVREIAS